MPNSRTGTESRADRAADQRAHGGSWHLGHWFDLAGPEPHATPLPSSLFGAALEATAIAAEVAANLVARCLTVAEHVLGHQLCLFGRGGSLARGGSGLGRVGGNRALPGALGIGATTSPTA